MGIRLFDFECLFFGHQFEAVVKGSDLDLCFLTGQGPACRECSGPTVKTVNQSFTFIPDDIPGGMVIENLDPTPRTFYSKSAYAQELKARGLVIGACHKGDPGEGTDKPRNGLSRWI